MIKRCIICEKDKEENEFYKKAANVCIDCGKQKSSYRVAKVKIDIIDSHGRKCSLCGYDKARGALHLHHTNSENKVRERAGSTAFIKESEKCILLCSNCHAELHKIENYVEDLNQFYEFAQIKINENRKKPSHVSECTICGKENSESYSNKKVCKECNIKLRKRDIVQIKLKALELKGNKCIKCGYDKYYGALHFHHTDSSNKNKDIKRKYSWNLFKKEIDKCIVICGNCHAEIHQKHDKEKILKFLEEYHYKVLKKSHEGHMNEGKPEKRRRCPQCGKEFEVEFPSRSQRFCSKECVSISYHKIGSRRMNKDLINSLKTMTEQEVCEKYHVQDPTIKYWKNRYKNQLAEK